MKKNDVFEIKITGMTDDGSGVGRAEGIAVFVPYTIVDETVRVHIIKVNKTYAVGKLIEVIKPSEHRVKAECDIFYKCGGCQLWHMDYTAELEYKYNKVKDCIRRIGGINTEVSAVVGSDNISRYRNKIQMPVSADGIGFYKKNSHDVVDVNDCLLQDKKISDIVYQIRKWAISNKIEQYNEKTNDGILRHIYIRTGDEGIMVVLVTTKEELPHTDKLIDALTKMNLPICSIMCNVNKHKTNVVLGTKNILLYGRDVICDKIGEIEFEISPNSFYQVNKEQTRTLYSIARRMANLKGTEIVWDLYCGIGTIGQYMADKASKIIGIEVVPEAIENARKNALNNGVANAKYYCGAAEKVAPELIKKGERADVVILDPPRKGCDETLLDTVIKAKPKRIVYISCKPATLARDLKYLSANGYNIKEIVPVDMFPRTCHVETVVQLCRENAGVFKYDNLKKDFCFHQ